MRCRSSSGGVVASTVSSKCRNSWIETPRTQASLRRHRTRIENARHSGAVTHRGVGPGVRRVAGQLASRGHKRRVVAPASAAVV
jgi:hypothetical protein